MFPGITPKTSEAQQSKNAVWSIKYNDPSDKNYTYILSNRLANIATSEADISVEGDGARSKLLNDTLQAFVIDLRTVVSRVLGTGGVVLKPATYNNHIYTEVISQDRFIEVEQRGGIITKAGFISDVFIRDSKEYKRIEYHELEDNGIYTIIQKGAIDNKPVELKSVSEWADIEPITIIQGVTQMLFSFVKCPIDSRSEVSSLYGVPITYGQQNLMDKISELQDDFHKEFVNKRVFIGVNDLLLNDENALPVDGVYKKLRTDAEDFWEIFDPAMREQSYSQIHLKT